VIIVGARRAERSERHEQGGGDDHGTFLVFRRRHQMNVTLMTIGSVGFCDLGGFPRYRSEPLIGVGMQLICVSVVGLPRALTWRASTARRRA
jgi:hypothetical protein